MSKRTECIAAALRGARAATKESQKTVAEVIGTSPSTLSNWEQQGSIGFDDAWALADHYGLTLDELAGRKSRTLTTAGASAAQSAAASPYAESDHYTVATKHVIASPFAPAV